MPTVDSARVIQVAADSEDESREWCEALFTRCVPCLSLALVRAR